MAKAKKALKVAQIVDAVPMMDPTTQERIRTHIDEIFRCQIELMVSRGYPAEKIAAMAYEAAGMNMKKASGQ